MSLTDSIINKVENSISNLPNKIKYEFESSTNQMKRAAENALNRAIDNTNQVITNQIDDILTDLEKISTGYMKNITYKVTSTINAITKRVNNAIRNTLTLNNAMNFIQNPSSILRNASATGSDSRPSTAAYANRKSRAIIENRATFNPSGVVSSVTSKLTSYLSEGGSTPSKLFDSAFEAAWDGVDPISEMADTGKYVRAIIEDAGFITDKFRSLRFSRSGIFVTRPVLEIDGGGAYKSFAFWTRPNCNLLTLNNTILSATKELVDYPDMYSLTLTDMELYAELCRDGCSKSNLFNLLSNYTKEVPPIRLTESNRDGVKNMFNKGIPMPGMPEIYTEADIPVTFVDNSRGDISKLLYALSLYKTLVGREGYPMRSEYIKYKGIDYLMSLYIVTVDPNWEIIGFGVALGMMISEPPTHFTQHRMDGFSKPELLEEFTVNFKCNCYIPYAPHYYDTFNRLFGFNPTNLVDTRGSGSCLFMTDRTEKDGTLDNGKFRSSVFSNDGGMTVSSANTDNINGYSSYGQFAKTLFDVGAKIVAEYANLPSLQTETINSTTMNALMPFPDVFEMMAKAPGVYTAVNQSEKSRRVFKLGFSW